MTVDQLVERYVAISQGQGEAIERHDSPRFNQLFGLREAVDEELKRRKGDQRRALLPLLEHRNLQVRLNAAKSTLAVDRGRAKALEAIQATQRMPQAADARDGWALEEGIFKPT